MIKVRFRDYFSTELFNVAIGAYFENFFGKFIHRYILKSAKGSSGRDFQDSRCEVVKNEFDMPYHVHILNGLLPALKMLEERFKKEGWDHQNKREQADKFLRCFCIGFTFHDINKLTGVDELNESLEQHLFRLCDELKLEEYFPDWKDWIEELKFLALSTEYRTKIYAHQKTIKEYDFFNTVLAEYCHFADSIASMDGFASTFEFYDQLCNKRFDGRKLSTLWQLSFVEVQENIFTLLSQKLLYTAKKIIKENRKQTIIFSLRNGFVYIGEPLTKDEIQSIKIHFKSDLSDVVKSALLDHQTCELGFLKSLNEENEEEGKVKYYDQIKIAIEKILKAGFTGKGAGDEQIKPFHLYTRSTPEEIEKLEDLIDENELPLSVVPQKAKDGTIRKYFLQISEEWEEVSDGDKKFLTLYFLEKLKLLYLKHFPQWKPQLCPAYRYSTVTNLTVTAILSAFIKYQGAVNTEKGIDDVLEHTWKDVVKALATSNLIKTVNTKELDDFVDFYISGNFKRDIEKLTDLIGTIPEKKDMCIFTGRTAKMKYGAERAFGISALNFSNRSVNTLKSKDNLISPLFCQENEFRLKELPRGFYTKKLKEGYGSDFDRRMFLDASKADTVIYYDLGEYFVEISSQMLLEILGKAMTFDCRDINGMTLIVQDHAYDFNLYGMNFNQIKDKRNKNTDVESNFYFIQQMLKLIQKTGFRIFVTSILTPYHQHREMFVFENCMPFVKALKWDRIRIDQIESLLREMNMLLSLNAKRLTSNILNYAKDRMYLFTAYAQLDEDAKAKAINGVKKFTNSNMEVLNMSVMNELAQIAIEMVRPKSGSTSQESWIIRDSLKVLKDCYKEKRDKDTTIEQISGDLRKTLKSQDRVDLAKCEPFAKTLYERLFEDEWKKHFPQPNRLRNWINQFAFLYSDKGYVEIRKLKVKKVIKTLKEEGKDFSEESVIQFIISENKKLEKYADDYREIFQEVIVEFK